MSKFIMLCGLPASGKSTLAKDLSDKHDAKILSSDELRKELLNDVNNQENNTDVFEEMNKRTKQCLNENINVIYDATNISRKRRVHLINHVLKADEKDVYYLNTPIHIVRRNDQNRQRQVGNEVIDRMYKTMQVPTKNEGWDKVIYYNDYVLPTFKPKVLEDILSSNDHDELFKNLMWLPYFDGVYNVSQDSKYHSFSVSRHIYYVFDYIKRNYEDEDKELLLWSAILHDIGKGFCKSFENYKGEAKRYANFIGHEYVSAQVAAWTLNHFEKYDVSFIKKVVDLIQFHMMPMKAGEKKMKQVEELIGKGQYKRLMFLHEADLQAK